MLFDYRTTLSLSCPICGELGLHTITIFDFDDDQTIALDCSCGFNKMTIQTNNYKQYWLRFPCVICEVEHLISYKNSELWSNQLKEIICVENDLQLGYLGAKEEVEALAKEEESLSSIFSEVGVENYFSQPEIMLSALNLLYDIAEGGGLFCQCGNQDIDIDMFPGKIELSCQKCDSLITINAEAEEDLNFLKNIKKIEMLEGVVSALEKKN
ncbi:MAG: hypothetical protein ACQEQI_01780 [Bacillota bacterium]